MLLLLQLFGDSTLLVSQDQTYVSNSVTQSAVLPIDIQWFKQNCSGYFISIYYFKRLKHDKGAVILYIKKYIFRMYKNTGAHSP